MANDDATGCVGCGCLFLAGFILLALILGPIWENPWSLVPISLLVLAVLAGIGWWYDRREKRAESARRYQKWRMEKEEAALHREHQRLAGVLAQVRQKKEREWVDRISGIAGRGLAVEGVHYMTGLEFEDFMARFLKRQGYDVEPTRASGDQGVDLLLNSGGRKIAVQLKRYTRPLGNKPVQEVLAGMFHYEAQEAWVVTTSSFTRGAVEIARSTGVRLIDGHELTDWLREAAED